MKNNREYILCAAIWFNNHITYSHQPRNISEGIVVCGRRHHNCFMTKAQMNLGDNTSNGESAPIQGFLTSDDRFVDRKVALAIALLAGQIEKAKYGEELYSEDLY